MVSAEGGAIEGLINHSCIVIDFLLKAVSQTLNYVFVCGRVCFTALTESTKSSITAPYFPNVRHCSWFGCTLTTFFISGM